MLKALPAYARKCLRLKISGQGNLPGGGAYSRDVFNVYGDDAYPREGPITVMAEMTVNMPGISAVCTERLNALDAFCRQRNATLVIAACPVLYNERTASPQAYAAFQEKLAQEVTCPVISDFRNYFYEPSLFYDGANHLSSAGAQLRTQQLASDIETYLDSRKADEANVYRVG